MALAPSRAGRRSRAGPQQLDRDFVAGPEILAVPQVAVSAPPFVALLARADDVPQAPYLDTGPWLAESVGTRRRVSVKLPVVKPFGDADVINQDRE